MGGAAKRRQRGMGEVGGAVGREAVVGDRGRPAGDTAAIEDAAGVDVRAGDRGARRTVRSSTTREGGIVCARVGEGGGRRRAAVWREA